jgi:hypothetical protein
MMITSLPVKQMANLGIESQVNDIEKMNIPPPPGSKPPHIQLLKI